MDNNPIGILVENLATVIDAASHGSADPLRAASPTSENPSNDVDPLGNLIRRLAAVIESYIADA